jgi:hypothetical protein
MDAHLDAVEREPVDRDAERLRSRGRVIEQKLLAVIRDNDRRMEQFREELASIDRRPGFGGGLAATRLYSRMFHCREPARYERRPRERRARVHRRAGGRRSCSRGRQSDGPEPDGVALTAGARTWCA